MGCCELGNGPEHGLLSRVWSAAQSQPCEPRRQGGASCGAPERACMRYLNTLPVSWHRQELMMLCYGKERMEWGATTFFVS